MSFDKPVISVGNLTVGGTGKTPHTEYLIRLLQEKYNVAVLSRGYKRKSKGFLLATSQTTMPEIGDEPYQMMKKFPGIRVAVDSDRCNGITHLLSPDEQPPIDVILLDDAYQHRYADRDVNILLMDFHRLVYLDRLLPVGRLREPMSGMKRASIIIVTKCPRGLDEKRQQEIKNNLNLGKNQKLFFTTFSYPKNLGLKEGERPLLLTGIASPKQIVLDLDQQCGLRNLEILSFPDHHNFSSADIYTIRQTANGRRILTTEKDAARLSSINHQLPIITIPIQVEFLAPKQKTEFDNIILDTINQKI